MSVSSFFHRSRLRPKPAQPASICRACASWARADRDYSTGTKKSGLSGLRSLGQNRAGKAAHELPKTPARTRFAPSPTGYLHLGSLRTALYNWMLARATGGQFIIRVEDTDQNRLVEGALPRLLDDLKWAELDWDEGPDVGGPYGPYEQSKRLNHYAQHARQLVDSGQAYRCFCTAEDLERHKQQTLDGGSLVHYPGTCRSIPPDQAARRAANGESHVIRFLSQGRPSFTDLVYGHYQKNEGEGDFILIKTDGYPTYHFANVVDDHLMQITHVIRGVEWLISTPKHVALYDAFKWTPPTFAHAGLLCGPDGEKLSKRNRTIDIDIASYRDKGILPSALNNWLALLGWSPALDSKSKGDVFPNMDQLVKHFTLKFTKGNAQLNPSKLPIFQRTHIFHLFRDPSVSESRLKDSIVLPLLRQIHDEEFRRHAAAKQEGSVEDENAPKEEENSPSLANLECLVPALDSSCSSSETQTTHLFNLLKTLADDSRASDLDPSDLLRSHPTLFFRPVAGPSSVRSFIDSLPEADSSGAYSLIRSLWSRLYALTEDCEVKEKERESSEQGYEPGALIIPPHLTQEVIDAALRDSEPSLRKPAYAWLRLLLTGDADRPAKPAKLQLAVLGWREVRERLLRHKLSAAETSLFDGL